MKQAAKDWPAAAEDDLLAAKALACEERPTNLASFHCQQCIEKYFKALIEKSHKPSIKSHDLIRLQSNANFQLSDQEAALLGVINEVYIDSRYPGDLGLLPYGKPTILEMGTFIQFSEALFNRVKNQLD